LKGRDPAIYVKGNITNQIIPKIHVNRSIFLACGNNAYTFTNIIMLHKLEAGNNNKK
jgi:hypothetical protein